MIKRHRPEIKELFCLFCLLPGARKPTKTQIIRHDSLTLTRWNCKEQAFNGCLVKQPMFDVMIRNHPIETTIKKTGCLEFQGTGSLVT